MSIFDRNDEYFKKLHNNVYRHAKNNLDRYSGLSEQEIQFKNDLEDIELTKNDYDDYFKTLISNAGIEEERTSNNALGNSVYDNLETKRKDGRLDKIIQNQNAGLLGPKQPSSNAIVNSNSNQMSNTALTEQRKLDIAKEMEAIKTLPHKQQQKALKQLLKNNPDLNNAYTEELNKASDNAIQSVVNKVNKVEYVSDVVGAAGSFFNNTARAVNRNVETFIRKNDDKGIIRNLGAELAKGTVGVVDAFDKLYEVSLNAAAGKPMSDTQKADLKKDYFTRADEAQNRVGGYLNNLSTVKEDSGFLEKVVKSTLTSATTLMTSAMMGNVIAGFGLSSAGAGIEEADARGMDRDVAVLYGDVQGVIEATFEKYLSTGFGKAVNSLGFRSVAEVIEQFGEQGIKGVAKQAVAEALQEGATEFANIVASHFFKDGEGKRMSPETPQEFVERIAVAMGSGALMGGVSKGAVNIANRNATVKQSSPIQDTSSNNITETVQNTVQNTNSPNKAQLLAPQQIQKLNNAFGFDVSTLLEENIKADNKTANNTSKTANNTILDNNNNIDVINNSNIEATDTIFTSKTVDGEGNAVYVKADGSTVNAKLFDMYAELNNIDVNSIVRSETETAMANRNEDVDTFINSIEDAVIEDGAEATIQSLNEELNSGAIDTQSYETAVNLVEEVNSAIESETKQETIEDNTTQHNPTLNNVEAVQETETATEKATNKAETVQEAKNVNENTQQEAVNDNTSQQETVNTDTNQHKPTQKQGGIVIPKGITAEQLNKAYTQDANLKTRMEEASKARQKAENKLKEIQQEVKNKETAVKNIDEAVNNSKTVKEINEKVKNETKTAENKTQANREAPSSKKEAEKTDDIKTEQDVKVKPKQEAKTKTDVEAKANKETKPKPKKETNHPNKPDFFNKTQKAVVELYEKDKGKVIPRMVHYRDGSTGFFRIHEAKPALIIDKDGNVIDAPKNSSVVSTDAPARVKELYIDPFLNAQNKYNMYLEQTEKLNKAVKSKSFKNIYPNVELTVVEKLTSTQQSVNKLGEAIEREVIFFKADGKDAPNGFMKNDIIFLNGDYSGSAMTQVLGHETFHTLKTTNKDSFKQLLEYGKENFTTKEITKFLAKIPNEEEVNKLKNNSDLLIEEMLAEAFGNDFANKNFWSKVEDKQPVLIRKIHSILKDIFRKAKNYRADFLTKKHIDELRDEFTNIFGELAANSPVFKNNVEYYTAVDNVGRVSKKVRKSTKMLLYEPTINKLTDAFKTGDHKRINSAATQSLGRLTSEFCSEYDINISEGKAINQLIVKAEGKLPNDDVLTLKTDNGMAPDVNYYINDEYLGTIKMKSNSKTDVIEDFIDDVLSKYYQNEAQTDTKTDVDIQQEIAGLENNAEDVAKILKGIAEAVVEFPHNEDAVGFVQKKVLTQIAELNGITDYKVERYGNGGYQYQLKAVVNDKVITLHTGNAMYGSLDVYINEKSGRTGDETTIFTGWNRLNFESDYAEIKEAIQKVVQSKPQKVLAPQKKQKTKVDNITDEDVKFSTRTVDEIDKITAPLHTVSQKTNNLQLRAGIHKLYGVKVDKNIDLVKIFNNVIDDMSSNSESTRRNVKELKKTLLEEGIESKEANAIAKYFTNIVDVAKATYTETIPVSKNVITSSSYRGKNNADIQTIVKKSFDELYTHFVDTNHAGNMINEVFYRKSRLVNNSFGVIDSIFTENLTDKSGNVVDKSLKEMFDNVFKANDIVEFMEYTLHKHNIARALAGKYVFFKEDGAPMSSTDSAKIVKQFESKYKDFADRQQELTGWINKFMEVWAVDTGLMSSDFHHMLKTLYNNYVPTNRSFLEHEELFGGGYGGKGFVDKSKTTKKAEKGGSDRNIIDIQESVVNLVAKTVRTAKMNEVGQELVKAVESNPAMKDLAEIVEKPNVNVDNVVRVLVGGEAVYVKVHNKSLLEMLEQVHTAEFHGLERISRNCLGFVKQLITSKNPFYAITNTARDYQTYMINSTEANLMKRWGAIGKAVKAIKSNTKEYQLYKAMGVAGSGMMAKNNTKTVENLTNLKSVIDKDTGALLGKKDLTNAKDLQSRVIKGWKNFNDAIEIITGTSETTFRLAEFISSMERGMDIEEATLNAMDVTVDFSRAGDYSRHIDSGVMYFNSGVQGIDKIARQIGKYPIQTVVRSIVHVAGPAVLLAALHSDDDDYKMLDNRTKDNNFLIPMYLLGGEEGQYLKIPKSREYGVIAALTERLIYGRGEEGSFDDLLRSVKENIAPNGVFTSNIITELAKAGDNDGKDFAGRYIIPKHLQEFEKDKWRQYDDNTTVLAKHLGKLLNFSPKYIDYYLDSYSGVIGDLVMPLLTPSTYSTQENDTVQNVLAPIRKKFVADNAYSSSATSKYYDSLNELSSIVNAEQDGLTASEKRKYTSEAKEFTKAINKTYGEDIKTLNDMLKDDTLSNREKRRVRQARNEAMKQANEAINRFLKPKYK